jgi:HNH endonuclease
MPIGSRTVTKKGYVFIKTTDGWLSEHRHVMERKLGRKLRNDELVHHRNEIKGDNREENLELVSARMHGERHRGRVFDRTELERLRAWQLERLIETLPEI